MSVPELVAHRGWTLRYPENTLAAVRGAIEAGARHVEVDVQLSADKVPFLFHDRILDRICGVPGRLHEKSARELDGLRAAEAYRFGDRFAHEPVARLEALAELVRAHGGVHVFVEVKRTAVEVYGVELVLERVLAALASIPGRFTLISFDMPLLQHARRGATLALGPVLETWEQRGHPDVQALAPQVVFCDLQKLPAAGRLDVPGGRLAIYEVDRPEVALALHARGAALIETFAIGELLEALRTP